MARFAANGRKAVQLSKSLHRDITTYALAAGAAGVSVLALSPPADAQIVYTPAHEFMGTNQKILIDFDHDGTTDAIIREVSCIDSSVIRANSLQAVPRKKGGGLQLGHYGWAAGALAFGSKIGPPAGFYTRAALMANIVTYLDYYWGSWVFARPSYLGVRFTIRGETHYGWARMGVQYDYRQQYIAVLLSGYAYESEADKPIRAGDTGVNDMEDREPAGEMLLPPPGRTGPSGSLGALARGAHPLHRCSL
jgi:hypothetical protein